MCIRDSTYHCTVEDFVMKQKIKIYHQQGAASNVLKLIAADTEDSSLKVYRGQALAARAYDYLNLVQIYQFTYALSLIHI